MGHDRKWQERRKGDQSNQSHNTENNQSHDTYMVITDTQENTKPPGRTHGLRPAHETARTLRHHYERKSCERVKDAYSIPHPQGQNGPCYCPYQPVSGHAHCAEGKGALLPPCQKQTAGFCFRVMDEMTSPLTCLPRSPASDVQHNRAHFIVI